MDEIKDGALFDIKKKAEGPERRQMRDSCQIKNAPRTHSIHIGVCVCVCVPVIYKLYIDPETRRCESKDDKTLPILYMYNWRIQVSN